MLWDKRVLGLTNYFVRRRTRVHPHYLQNALARLHLLAPDIVVITGDITCIGSPQEFNRALLALGALCHRQPYDVIYVPGNHDVYVGNRASREALRLCFRRLNHDRWHLNDLPALVTSQKLQLMVVDECCPTPIWSSTGALTERAREVLGEWFNTPRQDGEKRVLIGHFPMRDPRGRPLGWRRCLHGDDFLWDAYQAGKFDVALCGHLHDPFVREDAPDRMEICAGALTIFGKMGVLDYTPLTGKFVHAWEDVTGDGRTLVPVTDTWLPAGAGE